MYTKTMKGMLANILNMCRKGDDQCQQPIANTQSLLLIHFDNLINTYIHYSLYIKNKIDFPPPTPPANTDFAQMMINVTEYVYLLQCIRDISVYGIGSMFYDLYCEYLLETNIIFSDDTSVRTYINRSTLFADDTDDLEKQAKYNAAIAYFRSYNINTFRDYFNLYTELKKGTTPTQPTQPTQPTKDNITKKLGELVKFYKDYIVIFTEVANYYVGHFILLLNVVRTSMP
jgi:hypothetical protein